MKASFRTLAAGLVLALSAFQAQAAAPKAGELSGKEDAEYCATYLPCAIAVGLAAGAAQGETMWNKVTSFFDNMGRTPAKTREEFDAWVQSLPPSGRTDLVDRCAKTRGEDERDYCESIYLSPAEQKAIRDAKRARTASMSRGEAQRARDAIYDRDSTMGSFIQSACKGQSAESCQREVDALTLLDSEADKLNRNPDYQKYFPAVALNAAQVCKEIGCTKDSKGVWTAPAAKAPTQTAAPKAPPKELLQEPPSLPGETYVTTKDGCGVFAYGATDEKSAQTIRDAYGKYEWLGECRSGLLSGKGAFNTPASVDNPQLDFANGRILSLTTPAKGRFLQYTLGERTAVISSLPDPYAPTWNKSMSESSYLSFSGVSFTADVVGDEYKVLKFVSGMPGTSGLTYYDCPDPHSPKGCDALWYEKTAEIAAQIKAFIEEAKQKEPERIRQLAALNAQWDAQWPALQQSRKDAAAKAAANASNDQLEKAKKAGVALRAQDAANAQKAAAERQAAVASVPSTSAVAVKPAAPPPAPSAGAAAGSVVAKYDSVCARNAAKITQAVAGVSYVPAYSQFDTNHSELAAKVYESCMGYDPEAQRVYKAMMDEAEVSKTNCAGQYKDQCDEHPWGGVEALNKNFWEIFSREAQKALSDPNYSADFGTAYTPGSPLAQASARHLADETCDAELRRISAQMHAKYNALPKSEVVRSLEVSMWGDDASAKAIERLCPQSDIYKSQRDGFIQSFAFTKKSCDGIASRPCKAQAN